MTLISSFSSLPRTWQGSRHMRSSPRRTLSQVSPLPSSNTITKAESFDLNPSAKHSHQACVSAISSQIPCLPSDFYARPRSRHKTHRVCPRRLYWLCSNHGHTMALFGGCSTSASSTSSEETGWWPRSASILTWCPQISFQS